MLADAGESIARFVGSGLSERGDKRGPLARQLMPTKVFEADDFEAFLSLLPQAVDGPQLRHLLDVRHPRFMAPDYLQLARSRGFKAQARARCGIPQRCVPCSAGRWPGPAA